MTAHQAKDEFKRLLRDVMKTRGLIQEDVAATAGVDQTTVSRWVNGRAMPDPQPLEKLAEAYSLDLEHLLKLKLAAMNNAQPRGRKAASATSDEATPRIDEMAAAAGLGDVTDAEAAALIRAVERVRKARQRSE